ncbi:cytochrome P450 76A1 [Aplysia californica]|uniref:Cytochrome P450 76A1 n=1 Tax=Aplysia californica TaxID=6500 RepID=A0ABM1A6W4_APLCA|nr:cytochrome P450 76A1 [Aplysia californica]
MDVCCLCTTWTLAVGAAMLCVLYVLSKQFVFRKGNPPPGPRGWKGFMEILQANRDDSLYEAAWGWAEKYGDLTFYTVLGKPMCMLHSADIVRRVFGSDEYKLLTSDREPTVVSEFAWYNGKELFFTPYNSQTRQKRTLFHKIMGIYGEGVDKFESVVSKELDRVLEEMDTARVTDQDIPMPQILSRSLKIILYVLVNCDIDPARLSIDVTDTLERYDIAVNRMLDVQTLTALTFFPPLRKVGKYKKICDDVTESKIEAEKIMFEDLKFLANSWLFHHDPKIWDDPWKFKPERFLDESGVILPANHPVRKKILPFGHGIRMCPGEAFARSRVFLFVVSILQKFDLFPPENEPLPSCDPRDNLKGVIRQAPPFKCRLRNRREAETSKE